MKNLSAKHYSKEASERKVEINDFDASVVEAMLRLYALLPSDTICQEPVPGYPRAGHAALGA
jgi:hypothetical protein